MTLIEGRAGDGAAPSADSRLASIRLCTCVAVGARCPVGLGRIRADARARVAGPRRVTLIEGRAVDGAAPSAGARLASIRLSTCVAIGARGPIGFGRIRADARTRIAGPRRVALIGGSAGDWIAASAHAGLTGICLGAGIAVVAHRPVGLRAPQRLAGRRRALLARVRRIGLAVGVADSLNEASPIHDCVGACARADIRRASLLVIARRDSTAGAIYTMAAVAVGAGRALIS